MYIWRIIDKSERERAAKDQLRYFYKYAKRGAMGILQMFGWIFSKRESHFKRPEIFCGCNGNPKTEAIQGERGLCRCFVLFSLIIVGNSCELLFYVLIIYKTHVLHGQRVENPPESE